jgi:hypothetical protein
MHAAGPMAGVLQKRPPLLTGNTSRTAMPETSLVPKLSTCQLLTITHPCHRVALARGDSDHGAASRRSGADSGRLRGRIIGLGSNPRKRGDFVRRAWKSLRSQPLSKLMTRVRFPSPAPIISMGCDPPATMSDKRAVAPSDKKVPSYSHDASPSSGAPLFRPLRHLLTKLHSRIAEVALKRYR